MSPACRTTRSPATTRPSWHARWAAAWPASRRSSHERAAFAFRAGGGAARAGGAVRDLVPRRPPPPCRAAGVHRASAAGTGRRAARWHDGIEGGVLGRRARPVLVLARGDDRLEPPRRCRLGVGRDRAVAGRHRGRQLAGAAGAVWATAMTMRAGILLLLLSVMTPAQAQVDADTGDGDCSPQPIEQVRNSGGSV